MTTDDRTIARIRASYPIERRLMLDILIPADATPTDAHAVLSRVVADASIEIAERDEIIGRRERDIASLQGQLASAMADLNATREKLTTAEAFRDSLQAEADDAGKMLDAIRSMAGIGASRSEVDTLEVVRLRLECDREITAELRAERNALRAEVDKLRARPVLTVGMAERVISTYVDEFAATDRGRADAWAEVDQARRDHAIGVMKSTIDKLGDVTLPAQDRAAELAREIHRARLARLGQESNAIGIPALDDIRTALAKLAPAPTPSKPADVFAGVSIEDLCDAYDCAGACGSADVASRRCAGVAAVLDALRVKLVAPVDPEVVARASQDAACEATAGEVVSWLNWQALSDGLRASRTATMRATLTAKGIPVTPEAGK